MKEAELEKGSVKEDTRELNQREKGEGDMFGIRAIEAGFYAGVHQSRPTSRAGSVIDPASMSTSTLVGGVNSPLMKGHSVNTSVLSLNLSQPGSNPTQKRISPPAKLRPSQAELTGRHGAVETYTPQFCGSDDGESDGFPSPRSVSPADFHPRHYAPAAPKAMPVTYHADHANKVKSRIASINTLPVQSTPPSPGAPPATALPTLPATTFQRESRSPSPVVRSST